MANAGVDESNANGKIILLPRDSFKSANALRNYFKKKYSLKNFGVIISDSRSLPLRSGITAAVLCMGEGNERRQLALITDYSFNSRERVNKNELKINIKDDIYGPIFKKFL